MRLLIRSGKSPETVLGPEASLARNYSGVFGANVGNFLFSHGVHRLLNTPGSDLVVDSMSLEQKGVTSRHIERINSEFDAFILPLANAFRPSFLPWLDRLTSVISQLTIPVVVVGVGAQLGFSGVRNSPDSRLDDSVKRFCQAVLERSPSIGVRGAITADYLRSIGFPGDVIDVIGCPSMYVHGPGHTVAQPTTPLTSASKLAFNVTPSVPGMSSFLKSSFQKYEDSVLIQQEFRELDLMMWGTPIPGYKSELPGTVDHWMYQQNKLRFFLDTPTWFEFLRTRDFSVGNRIHGTIAALSAGTPSVLISHDSRTRELAEFHGIPFVAAAPSAERLAVEKLYEELDLSVLNAKQPENFEVFSAFLARHSLNHTFSPGFENPDYEAMLADTSFPAPVSPLLHGSPEQLVSRLQWLRQGIQGDQRRKDGAYSLPFAPASHQVKDDRELIAELREQAKALQRQLSKLEEQLRQHESHFNYMRQPLEKRMKRGFQARARRMLRR